MKKCSVGSKRKRSAESKTLVPSATETAETSSALTRSALTKRGARQNDAEDERRNAKQPGANERESVPVDERAPRGQPFAPHAGESLREFADVSVRGAQQRVLRRSIAETREARHVCDQRDAREADAEVVGRDDGAEDAKVGARMGERGEVRDDENLEDDAGDQRPHVTESQRAEAARGDAGHRGDE